MALALVYAAVTSGALIFAEWSGWRPPETEEDESALLVRQFEAEHEREYEELGRLASSLL